MYEEQLAQFQMRMDAMKMIIQINDPEKYKELSKLDAYWAPETKAVNYTQWVQDNYPLNPNDLVTLNVYSLLMNMPLEELKQKMERDLGIRKEEPLEIKESPKEELPKIEQEVQNNKEIREFNPDASEMTKLAYLFRKLKQKNPNQIVDISGYIAGTNPNIFNTLDPSSLELASTIDKIKLKYELKDSLMELLKTMFRADVSTIKNNALLGAFLFETWSLPATNVLDEKALDSRYQRDLDICILDNDTVINILFPRTIDAKRVIHTGEDLKKTEYENVDLAGYINNDSVDFVIHTTYNSSLIEQTNRFIQDQRQKNEMSYKAEKVKQLKQERSEKINEQKIRNLKQSLSSETMQQQVADFRDSISNSIQQENLKRNTEESPSVKIETPSEKSIELNNQNQNGNFNAIFNSEISKNLESTRNSILFRAMMNIPEISPSDICATYDENLEVMHKLGYTDAQIMQMCEVIYNANKTDFDNTFRLESLAYKKSQENNNSRIIK